MDSPKDDLPREHGPQPLAARMEAEALTPAHLVRASPVQITHKMVSRAMKGRHLTSNTMAKVVNAYNAARPLPEVPEEAEDGSTPAPQTAATARELFNYLPAPLRERREP